MKETEQTLLDQIIDDVAKENGGYKYHRSILNDEFWRIVCERYAEAKAKAKAGMAWIKATERLPQHMVQVSLKISGSPYSGRYDYSLKRFICPNMGPSGQPINNVEWLDESCEIFTRSQVQASCEATLIKASENGKCEPVYDYSEERAELTGYRVKKSSIISKDNIVIV